MFAMIIIIFSVGSNVVVGNFLPGSQLKAADLQTLNIYAMQILSGVIMVAMCINFISLSRGSMERICEILNEKSSLENPENPVIEMKDGSVEFENVNFAYAENSDEYVLEDINLKIAAGETVGIIGATGSGKTSLVSLVDRKSVV